MVSRRRRVRRLEVMVRDWQYGVSDWSVGQNGSPDSMADPIPNLRKALLDLQHEVGVTARDIEAAAPLSKTWVYDLQKNRNLLPRPAKVVAFLSALQYLHSGTIAVERF